MEQAAPAKPLRAQPQHSRSTLAHAKAVHIGTAQRPERLGPHQCTGANRGTDLILTVTGTALDASRTVGDDENRNIRIEASVLAALIAFTVMANALLWFRS